MPSQRLIERDERYFVETAARTIAMLRAVEELRAPASLGDLVGKLGWSKPMAYRLVRTLESLGALRQVDGNGYVLGPVLITLGLAALRATHLPQIAHPHLERLAAATAETVFVASLDGDEVVYLDRIDSADLLLRARLEIGSRLPAYVTASGKVLLAALPDDEVRARLARREFTVYGPNTRMSIEAVLDDLATARLDGYALTENELTPGHCSAAAPVSDHTGKVVASIGVSGSLARIPPEQLLELAKTTLLPAARDLSAALGDQPLATRMATSD